MVEKKIQRGGGENAKEQEEIVLYPNILTLDELFEDQDSLKKFIDCYVDVFNAQGEHEWGENWTGNQVREMLNKHKETGGEKSFVNLLKDGKGEAAGLFYGYIMENIEELQDLPPDFANDEEILKTIKKTAKDVLNLGEDEEILAMREMGIRKEYRKGGFERIQSLVGPLFRRASKEGIKHFLFWTGKHSNMFKIAVAFDFEIIYDFKDNKHVYIGADLDKLLSDLSQTPEKIGEMMQRNLAKFAKK